MTTVAFTGHRPKSLCGYDPAAYRDFTAWLAGFIKYICTNYGVHTFYSGGAQGFDQLAFFAVDLVKRRFSLDIKNNVILPCKDYSSKWLEEGLFSKADFSLMLEKADSVQYAGDFFTYGNLRLRNHMMVNNSDTLVALYNGDDWVLPDTKSGTAECMRYAEQSGIKIIQIPYVTYTGKLEIDRSLMK